MGRRNTEGNGLFLCITSYLRLLKKLMKKELQQLMRLIFCYWNVKDSRENRIRVRIRKTGKFHHVTIV